MEKLSRFYLFFLLIIGNTYSFSQKEGNVWYFGSAGIDFNLGIPIALTNSSMNTNETCATMSDSNGNLLFYTNGGSLWSSIGAIWNRNHQIMPNGLLMDTAGCSSASQGCMIIPNPGNNNEYYLFTVDCVENQFSSNPINKGLRYTKVNMTLDSGLGDVTEKGVLVMPIPLSSIGSTGNEKVCAIPHSNGTDYWILANKNFTICKVLVSATGIGPYVCQNFGTGQITPSPMGNKVMIGNVLYNFNSSNGILSDSLALNGSYSAFSSNGKVLYTKVGNSLLQYDLTAPNILASVITITSNLSEVPRLAPNGKIYFFGGSGGQFLNGVINCPNKIGLGCDYITGTILDLGSGKNKKNSVPNFLQSYFYKSNESNQSITTCSNYLWSANNQNYTQSGLYSTTVSGSNGCDSILKLNLTILPTSISFDTIIECNTYTWSVNGQTYNQTGQYSSLLTNINGCDSSVILNLTILQPSSSIETVVNCDSYTWNLNGQNYAQTGQYSEVLSNINGCDSTVTLNLTITPAATGTDNITSCDPITWIDGIEYTTSNGNATFTILGGSANGCDSIVTLNLTINSINGGITMLNNNTLESTISNSQSYQWVDCNNNFQNIIGETNQSFVADFNSSFAVIVTENGCSDTSDCILINTLGLYGKEDEILNISPNPTSNSITIKGKEDMLQNFKIFDQMGREVYKGKLNGITTDVYLTNLSKGIYTLKIDGNYKPAQIVKE